MNHLASSAAKPLSAARVEPHNQANWLCVAQNVSLGKNQQKNSQSRSIGYWTQSNRVWYSIQNCCDDCLFITRDVFVQLLDIFFLNLVFSLIAWSTEVLPDLCFHGLNKQSLFLFLGEGVLFVLIHLLFRSSITDHIWRTTDLLITHLLQVNRIPNKQKASLLSGKRGCFILKFSHNGRYNHRWNRESVLFLA